MKHLHKLGFKTFSHVIDESYDEPEFPPERIRMVVNEVERLCRDNVELIESTLEIRAHNRMVMYKLSEEVYWDLYQIIATALPEYAKTNYVDLPNLTLEQFVKYV